MTNDFRMSRPADPSDVGGTSWILNEAGTGQQGKRTFAQHRFDAGRAQPPVVHPLPQDVGPTLIPERGNAFLQGVLASELPHARPGLGARLAGGVLGAVIGVKAFEMATRNRRAR